MRFASGTVRRTKIKRNNRRNESRPKTRGSQAPVHPILQLQSDFGNQAFQRMLRAGIIQAKLKFAKPGDQSEQEADRVAEHVMRMSSPKGTPVAATAMGQPPGIERTCPISEDAVRRQADAIGARGEQLQRQPQPAQRPALAPNFQPGVSALQSGGAPLAPSQRAFFEPRLGRDFSQVRVHSDDRAADMAKTINAKAFTVGHSIAFGAGEYSPNTAGGRRLLAHELVHVIQQAGVGIENDNRTSRLQRKIGDGHDLQAERFAGDSILEACFDGEQLLKVGRSGTPVAKIQQALIDAGFPLPQFGVDSKFGKETKKAVENFQRESGLTGPDIDGIVGPITMGLLDARFLGVPPQPTTQCPDEPVNADKDPLPAVPPFTFRTLSVPELLEEVKKMQPPEVPLPKKVPLAASQPRFTQQPVTVSALPIPGASCMKCVAEWELPAEFIALIGVGSFTDEPKRFAAIQQGDFSGCPSKPIPELLEVRKIILPEALLFLLAGEFEHYLDFVRAFHIAGGRYLGNVRRLTAERTHLRAKDKEQCEEKVQEFLIRAHGNFLSVSFPFLQAYTRTFASHFTRLYEMPNRDASAHDAFSTPSKEKPPIFPNIDLDKNPFGCSAFCRKFNARSFPGIPGGSSETLVQDNNMPRKNAWHQL
jgi:peptidoglycan hydrolase-like protein with peptidoglycan-binding domain